MLKSIVGYFPLRNAVDKIIDQPQENLDASVLFGWRPHLVVLMVMLCEAARFHLIFYLLLELWNCQTDRKLPEGVILFMKNWSYMSSVARGDRPDNGYQPPDKIDLYDED